MRPPMLIALALAVGLSAWVAFQDDGNASIEPVQRDKGSSRRSAATQAPLPAKRQADRASAPPASKAHVADALALTQGIAQWQARVAMGPLQADARRPWASQRPPPPPPPPVVAPPPPPPPMAPPFPHDWVGRFNDEPSPGSKGVDRAIVSSANSTWVVGVGDVIEGQWRIDRIQDRQMGLTYLPLQQSQTIAMKAP